MSSERRQFERLRIPTEAIALDDTGCRLGLVTEAGGGGMAVRLDPEVSPTDFIVGARLRITIVEPLNEVHNVLPAEVRYVTGSILGLAFTPGKAAEK